MEKEVKTAKGPKRIFLLGMSPMPFENDTKVYGTGIRTWQFLKPLLSEGHQVCVCNYAIPSAYGKDFYSSLKKDFETGGTQDFHDKESKQAGLKYRFDYNILTGDDFENIEIIEELYTDFEPDCIIGCSFYPSYIASKLASYLESRNHAGFIRRPLWADLFGHVMAEAQARAFADDDDGCLFHYWNSEYNIITTADIFSCVSDRQKYALAGELGAAGRLNKFTSGYEFAHTIACGMPSEEFKHTKNVIRGFDGVRKEDFVILWTGGYNTWTDIDTLFKGLEKAMKINPSIKFVSTGGEIPEQDLNTYPRFLSMIEKSNLSKNFIMRGWIAGEDVPSYYFEADAGINIDKDIYEVKLGSKNRILDWMRAGLVVLSSNVCELTEIIEREKIGYTFKPGNADELADRIIYLAENKDEARRRATAAKKYGFEHFSFDATTVLLKKWAGMPFFAPDYKKEKKIFFDREEALKNLQAISTKQNEMIRQRDLKIHELETLLHKNPVYRFYAFIKVALKIFRKK
ncbi:MAG: glycosyltransferase family 4 protein [Actinobacteria bacterium]|nr:glycosyltransferase family 4 protein [Actinomycetota bacterium]